MFHYTIFAGSETPMSASGFFAVTVFGAAELKRPTLAQRVMQADEEEEPQQRSWWSRMTDSKRNSVLTIFGVTELQQPTLMEEYSSLRALVSSGAITPIELRDKLRRIMTQDANSELTSITLFGVFEDSRPGRNKQLKALASGEKAGLISSDHRRRLDEIADASPNTGIEVLGQLVTEPA